MADHSRHLTNGILSAVIGRGNTGEAAWYYLGPALGDHLDLAALTAAVTPPVPQAFLDEPVFCPLVPTTSEGVFSCPALQVHTLHDWLPHLQHEAFEQPDDHTLVIIQRAERPAIQLRTTLRLDPHLAVLTAWHSLENAGTETLNVQSLDLALPVPAHLDELLHFTGRWCQEFTPQRQRLQINTYRWENRKGRTSHDHFPGLLLGQPGFAEDSGTVMAAHLAWSGNHQQQIIVDQFQPARYQAGCLLAATELSLEPGELSTSPELHMAWSASGINGIRRVLHDHVRQNILRFPQPRRPRPVHLNTWEAVYFRHETEDLKQLADAARRLGIERYILDDGWFAGRTDDRRALGDWFVDAGKYPQGLAPLADHVVALGMEFGLWFEPEMISNDSELHRQHPDWYLHLDTRHQIPGRYQYALDLTRTAVTDYLFARLDALFSDLPIRYIKWDMNRDLVQAGDAMGRPAYQRQVLALYALLDRLRAAHPQVEIESCASGGGRMDYAILQRTQRFWTSDCNDPLERQMIQWGAGIFFPPEVLGMHIGPSRSHTTQRVTSLNYRALTALFGHFGVEADVRELDEGQARAMGDYIAFHQANRDWWHQGNFRVWDYPDPATAVYGIVSADQARATVAVAQQRMPSRAVGAPIRLTGLAPGALYAVNTEFTEDPVNHRMKTLPKWFTGSILLSGLQLSEHGLTMPVLDPASAFLIIIERREP